MPYSYCWFARSSQLKTVVLTVAVNSIVSYFRKLVSRRVRRVDRRVDLEELQTTQASEQKKYGQQDNKRPIGSERFYRWRNQENSDV